MPLLNFPPDMYQLRPGETPMYGDFPDLKRCCEWFRSLMEKSEWEKRRDNAAKRFYQSITGEFLDPTGVGKFFNDRDVFGWYLFLGEAFTDHPWNYEVVFGCRVVPILATIGGNLDRLTKIEGFKERCLRLIGPEKSQPNGGLFEALVAGAYASKGAQVAFRPEKPGGPRSHDLEVSYDGKTIAVECKRMEAGEYVERERQRMRELWKDPCLLLVRTGDSIMLEVDFKIELQHVRNKYLLKKVEQFIKGGSEVLKWDDKIATGIAYTLDIRPIQQALSTSHYLYPGPVYNKLLTGIIH